MVGKTLSHYEIHDSLGAGGMGEVYRARDTKLDRDVAIKVLPDDLAADPDRLARFEREAKLLAALSHANIGSIYGLEESDGVRFLVLELIEGETLEQRLRKGAIPVPEALDIARQIAEALEAAHDAGIIHRDVKPANVLLTGKGGVKVLDFGIAKNTVLDAGVGETELATSLTMDGTLMGTPPYMAPEQIRGEEADKRADIWAFGCVLYEMLTGRGAFVRETVADTLVAVLESEPDWATLPGGTSAPVVALLQRCLRKDPGRRLHDIADARIEIEEAAIADPLDEAAVASASGGRAAPWLAAAALALLGVAIGYGLAMNLVVSSGEGIPNSAGQARRVELMLPEGVTVASTSFALAELAVSPDGRQVVFRGRQDGTWYLFRRDLRDGRASVIPGTEGGTHPFFSPAGDWIGFISSQKLMKVRLEGGTPQELADAPDSYGAAWGDGVIVFNDGGSHALQQVPDSGGETTRMTTLGNGAWAGSHWFPSFLPDGRSFLFIVWRGGRNYASAVYDARTGEWKILLDNATAPRYVPSGHILFGRGTEVYAAPFDLETLAVGDDEVPVVSDVGPGANPARQFAVSETGVFAWFTRIERQFELVAVDLAGDVTPMGSPPRAYSYPRFSPDGTQIVVEVDDVAESDILVFDLETKRLRDVSPEGMNRFPEWSVDGTSIFYSHYSVTPGSVESGSVESDGKLVSDADGSKTSELLYTYESLGGYLVIGYWPPDGEDMIGVFWSNPSDGENERYGSIVSVAPGEDPPEIHVIVPGEPGAGKFGPQVSPDGLWIAYVSTESESHEVYVTSAGGEGATYMVSEGAEALANKPKWSDDGTKIYYMQDGDLWVAEVSAEPELSVGTARPFIDLSGISLGRMVTVPNYDVAPDGQSFVMVREVGENPPLTHISVVLNFFELLQELVPTGR